jgi:hypothetical protein
LVALYEEAVSKVHHLPLALPARVLLLKEEEKNNILLIIFFPSFVRRGVMPEGS